MQGLKSIDSLIKSLEKSLEAEEIEHQKTINAPGYTEKLITEIKEEIDSYQRVLPHLNNKQIGLAKYRFFTDMTAYEQLLKEVKSTFNISEYMKSKKA